MKKTALVTGGAGFIGTNLIQYLLNKNMNVISVDDYSTGSRLNHIQNENVVYLNHNIADDITWIYNEDIDIIFHLAAKARIQPSFDIPIEYFKVNSTGTMNVCGLALKYNIPVIYAGSSSHHGGKFKNPYTFSKDIGEDILELYKINYGLQYSVARFYNVYGEHELIDSEYATLIGKCKYSIINNLPITIYGDGTKRRDFTHVKYIVDGLYRIYDKKSYGNVFEFGTGNNYSINEVVSMFKYNNIEYESDRKGEVINTLCDDTNAVELLGWNVNDDLESYIGNFINVSG